MAANDPTSRPRFLGGGIPAGKSELDEGKIDKNYDPVNYYMRSVDSNGNRDTVRVEFAKFPPFLQAQVMKWVNDDRTPYKSVADYLRDAAVHRDRQLAAFDTDELHDWGPWKFLTLSEKREQLSSIRRDMAVQAEQFQKDFAEALQQQDFDWITELVELGKESVTALSEPYKGRIEAIILPYVSGAVQIISGQQS